MEGHLEAASKKIKKIAARGDSDSKKFLKEALEELQEGINVVAERQKHIRIADQSEYHWRMMEAYKVGALGDSDEDVKNIKEAESDVAHQMSREKRKPSRESRPPPPPPNEFPQWVLAVPQTQQMFLPQQAPPRHQEIYKPPGPCFNCFQMGHIKANCPRQTRPQYPLSSIYNNIQLTVCGSMLDNFVIFGNALVKSTVCEKVLDSSYNNISAFCGNDDSSPGHLVSNSSSGEKESPEVRSSISVDSVKVSRPLAEIGHPAVESVSTLPNVQSENGSSGIPLHIKDTPGHAILSDPIEGEVNHTEVPGPDDVQALTTFWEVEKGRHR